MGNKESGLGGKPSTRSPKIDADPLLTAEGLVREPEAGREEIPDIDKLYRNVRDDDIGRPPAINGR
jgi:hypothetical protein